MTTRCDAKNPATCRYHGNLENLENAEKKASMKYVKLLRAATSANPPAPADIEKAQQAYDTALTFLEAHEKPYSELIEAINDFNGYYPEDMDGIDFPRKPNDKFIRDHRKSLFDRKKKADEVRAKVKNPIILSNVEISSDPVEARVQKADTEYALVQIKIHTFNRENPDYAGRMLQAIAANQPLPTSQKLENLGHRLNIADREQTAARKAAADKYQATRILDRNDPEFLKTLDRKGFNRY